MEFWIVVASILGFILFLWAISSERFKYFYEDKIKGWWTFGHTSILVGVSFTVWLVTASIYSSATSYEVNAAPQIGAEQLQAEYDKQWLGGYGTGKDAGYREGYKDGKEVVTSSAFNEGYNKGYDKGYAEGKENSESTSNTSGNTYNYSNNTYDSGYSQIVYITETGSKYHNWGCQYLSQSCIKVSLEYALDKGLTACSRCW